MRQIIRLIRSGFQKRFLLRNENRQDVERKTSLGFVIKKNKPGIRDITIRRLVFMLRNYIPCFSEKTVSPK